MNSPLLFIPATFCVLLCFVGLAFAAVALAALLRLRAPQQRRRPKKPQPPLLSGAREWNTVSVGWRAVVWKCLLTLGCGGMALGLIGLRSTRFSVAYDSSPAPVWSDGRAPDLEASIRRHCLPFVNQGKTIGLAAAVVTPNNATIMTFGRPSMSSRRATGPDTLFEIGSITKTFTGLALARAVERGTVRLDTHVQALLPPGVDLPEPAREVTLRQLTSHSSGFPRMPTGHSPLRGLGILLLGSDPYSAYREADLLADVRTVKLESKPGVQRAYSNFGLMLLGYLLARQSGSSYEALIKREVCGPLGLTDTMIRLDRTQKARVAQGYRTLWRCGPAVLALRSARWFEESDLGGAGALRSTPADMLKYLQANMHPEGQPLEHALKQSHHVLFQEDKRTAYGMSWIHVQSQRLKRELICHNGGTGGFRSFIGFTGDRRLGVLILSNSSEDVDDLAVGVLQELLREGD